MGLKDLRVYQAAELLRKEVDKIIAKVGKGFENEVKHVDEAADSVLNNIAEGSASTYPKKPIYFWQMTKGSANEVGGGLHSLVRRGAILYIDAITGIRLAISVAKMLNNMR